jgi:hypothetical protein
MSEAVPPLPQYASMARYSVKAQGQLYLYLLPSAGFDPSQEFDLKQDNIIHTDIHSFPERDSKPRPQGWSCQTSDYEDTVMATRPVFLLSILILSSHIRLGLTLVKAFPPAGS